MGIKGLYAHLSKKELQPEQIDVKELAQDSQIYFELDLFGTFFYMIHSIILTKYNQANSVRNCGLAMGAVLQQVFGASTNVKIHINGPRCQEKSLAYNDRDTKRTAASARLDVLLSKMRERSAKGKWCSRSLIKEVKSKLRQLFTFDQADRSILAQALRTKFLNVCLCKTVSDLCIASECATYKDRYVMSGDSDFLIYSSVSNVLRPIPNRHLQFAKYTKDDVLQTLELPSESHLLLYGIVSHNDYSKNVSNLGLVRNANIIAKIIEGPIPVMLTEYIKCANEGAQSSSGNSRFNNAVRVFHDLQQTQSPHQINKSEFVAKHSAMVEAMSARYQNKNQNTTSR